MLYLYLPANPPAIGEKIQLVYFAFHTINGLDSAAATTVILVFEWHSTIAGGIVDLVQLAGSGTSTLIKPDLGVDVTNIYLHCANDSFYGVINSQR